MKKRAIAATRLTNSVNPVEKWRIRIPFKSHYTNLYGAHFIVPIDGFDLEGLEKTIEEKVKSSVNWKTADKNSVFTSPIKSGAIKIILSQSMKDQNLYIPSHGTVILDAGNVYTFQPPRLGSGHNSKIIRDPATYIGISFFLVDVISSESRIKNVKDEEEEDSDELKTSKKLKTDPAQEILTLDVDE